MRTGIHPNYVISTVTCACGNSFQTRSVKEKYHLEICSECHPFFTGKQKLVDSAGRVERFQKRFQKTQGQTIRTKAKTKEAKLKVTPPRGLTTTARKVEKKTTKTK